MTDRFADGDEKDSSIEEAGRTRSAFIPEKITGKKKLIKRGSLSMSGNFW